MEFVRHNKCPECSYAFPFPYAKVWELEKLFRSGEILTDGFNELLMNMVQSISGKKEREVFLRAVQLVAKDTLAWLTIMKTKGREYSVAFGKLDKDEDFQKFLNMGPPQTKGEPINMKRCKEGMRKFNEKFLH